MLDAGRCPDAAWLRSSPVSAQDDRLVGREGAGERAAVAADLELALDLDRDRLVQEADEDEAAVVAVGALVADDAVGQAVEQADVAQRQGRRSAPSSEQPTVEVQDR